MNPGHAADSCATFTTGAAGSTTAWFADVYVTDSLGHPAPPSFPTRRSSDLVIKAATQLTIKTAPSKAEPNTSVTIIVTETNTGTDTLTNVNVTGGPCAT